jgi:hypothetical protein
MWIGLEIPIGGEHNSHIERVTWMIQKINLSLTALLGTSWRTTVLGFIGAVFVLVSQGLTVKSAIIAAGVQIFGACAKDQWAHSTPSQVEKAGTDAAVQGQ